jgi:hypothetical protein
VPALEDFAEPLGFGEGFFESGGEHEHEDTRALVADAEKEWGTPRGKYTNAPCSARNRSSPQTKSTVPLRM